MSEITDKDIILSKAKQFGSLTSLEKNWDGYGAEPLNPQFVSDVMNEVMTEGALCDFVPGSDGSIQAEWHLRGDVDVEYQVHADGSRSLYVSFKPTEPTP